MSTNLLNTIRGIVREEMQRLRTVELAIVQETHPHASDDDTDNYACTVKMRDSDLVLARVPVLTGKLGVAAIPAAGDLVIVQFVRGDLQAPLITGAVYNDQDRPPPSDEGDLVLHLPLGADPADAVSLRVRSAGAREAVLSLGAGLRVEVRDDDPVIVVDVNDASATVQIDRDGTIALSSSGDINVSGANVTIEATGTLDLKAAAINLN